MFIAVYHTYSFTIQCPWLGLLVEVHIMLGTSNNNLCLFSVKPKLVPLGIVGNDVQGPLEATGAAGEQVGIVSNTDPTA